MSSKATKKYKFIFLSILILLTTYFTSNTFPKVFKYVITSKTSLNSIDDSLSQHPLGTRKYILNGQELYGTLYSTKSDVNEVFDQLAYDHHQRLVASSNTQNQTDSIKTIIQNINKPIDIRQQGWGLFADLKLLINSKTENLSKHSYKSEASYGERKSDVVFALETGDKTDVWLFEFPSDQHPIKLIKALNTPAPAIQGSPVSLFESADRVLSLTELTKIGATHIEIHAGGGSINDHTMHHINKLEQKGYMQKQNILTDDGRMLQFSGDRGTVDIMIAKSTDGSGATIDTIQYRVTSP